MKLGLKAFGLANKPDTPVVSQELFLQVQSIQQLLAVPMRAFGISTVQIDIIAAVPIAEVKVMTKDMDTTNMPVVLLNARKRLLRGIKEFMLLFGLHEISISLSDNEWAELQAYWKYLSSGNTEALDKEQFKDTPLRFEVDPVAAVEKTNDDTK